MWFIEKITRIHFPDEHLLPSCQFILTDGKTRKDVKGWLPCHHTNVAYELQLVSNRIYAVIDMCIDKKKKQKTKVVTETARKIKTQKNFAPKLLTADTYKTKAMKAYTSMSLWVCSVVYSHWELRHMNIDKTFQELTRDIESLIQPDSIASRPKFIFQSTTRTKSLIKCALRQMGELPYQDWEGFEARREWHLTMKTSTGMRSKPSEHIRCLERYQDLWTTSYLIEEAKQLKLHFRPDNVTLIQGSPTPSNIPADAHIVVKNVEDAYRWKCIVHHGNLHVLDQPHKMRRLIQLGVSDVKTLQQGLTLYMPWAHTWGQQEWIRLATFQPKHLTCIGRIDQWPAGRGQTFRDMLHSKKFDVSTAIHTAVECVQMIETDDLKTFVAETRQKHSVVQCFTEQNGSAYSDIDCGRRFLKTPNRIRTLKPGMKDALHEELKIHFPDREDGNASVQNIRTYKSLVVPAGIYLCSEDTTPFDIHVARTFCRDILYVVNCTTCLFAMQKVAPLKCTINPFI